MTILGRQNQIVRPTPLSQSCPDGRITHRSHLFQTATVFTDAGKAAAVPSAAW
ncbi:MAG: hypothetical protein R3E56_06160 [Burkholderiaceae bacterium]